MNNLFNRFTYLITTISNVLVLISVIILRKPGQ
jgi:hypothetical protein